MEYITLAEDEIWGGVAVYFNGVFSYKISAPNSTFWSHVASRQVLRADECGYGKSYMLF